MQEFSQLTGWRLVRFRRSTMIFDVLWRPEMLHSSGCSWKRKCLSPITRSWWLFHSLHQWQQPFCSLSLWAEGSEAGNGSAWHRILKKNGPIRQRTVIAVTCCRSVQKDCVVSGSIDEVMKSSSNRLNAASGLYHANYVDEVGCLEEYVNMLARCYLKMLGKRFAAEMCVHKTNQIVDTVIMVMQLLI